VFLRVNIFSVLTLGSLLLTQPAYSMEFGGRWRIAHPIVATKAARRPWEGTPPFYRDRHRPSRRFCLQALRDTHALLHVTYTSTA